MAKRKRKIRFYSNIKENNFLDNFHHSPFWQETFEGSRLWNTVEHFYQAHKSTELSAQEWVRRADTPGEAKRRGREVKMRPEWEFIKEAIMMEALRLKFEPGTTYAYMLVATGNAELIEASKTDSYWGEGRDKKGQNRMGHLLMQLREELRESHRSMSSVQ